MQRLGMILSSASEWLMIKRSVQIPQFLKQTASPAEATGKLPKTAGTVPNIEGRPYAADIVKAMEDRPNTAAQISAAAVIIQ